MPPAPPDHSGKPGFFNGYWLAPKPGRDSGIWYITWYDRSSGKVRRRSTEQRDFSAAHRALVEWALENERPRNAPRDQLLIDTVMVHYWKDHAQHRPSAKTAKREMGVILSYWEGKSVSTITPDEQRLFREHLAKRGTGAGGIDRILSTFRAALNHARKMETVESVPHVFGFRKAEALRSRDPKGRPLSIEELAALFDAADTRHFLMYLVLAVGTLGRPGAILDLTAVQYDQAHDIVDLNPPGREQNKKWRPTIPVAPSLAPWLKGTEHPKTGHYVTYRNHPIGSILHAFRDAKNAAKLTGVVTPYSIRHTLSREMRKARVTTEEIGLFLGHIPQGTAATTSIYAPYEPDFLAAPCAVVEDVLQRLGALTKKVKLIGERRVVIGGNHLMAVPTGRAYRGGIGEAKRTEVRRLILAGVPHKQIREQTGVSDGTISALRKALRDEEIPVLRTDR